MRLALAVLLLAVSGCTDPVSCEALNARQPSDALRTCVSSSTFDGEPVTAPLADGTALTVDRLPPLDQNTFADGVRLFHYQGHLGWTRGRETFRRDSIGDLAGSVRVHPDGRYAVPLPDGRLLLRSRDGSDPVDLPVEIAWRESGDKDDPHSYYLRYPTSVFTSFSADGRRLAYSDADSVVVVVDARTGEPVWRSPPTLDVGGVTLSADGTRIALGLPDNTLAVWDLASSQELGRWVHPRPPSRPAFGADGSLIVWLEEVSTISKSGGTTSSGNAQSARDTHTKPPAVIVWRVP